MIEIEVVADSSDNVDLSVLSVEVPEQLQIGIQNTVGFVVENQGDAKIDSQKWRESIYLSADPYLDLSDVMVQSQAVSIIAIVRDQARQ